MATVSRRDVRRRRRRTANGNSSPANGTTLVGSGAAPRARSTSATTSTMNGLEPSVATVSPDWSSLSPPRDGRTRNREAAQRAGRHVGRRAPELGNGAAADPAGVQKDVAGGRVQGRRATGGRGRDPDCGRPLAVIRTAPDEVARRGIARSDNRGGSGAWGVGHVRARVLRLLRAGRAADPPGDVLPWAAVRPGAEGRGASRAVGRGDATGTATVRVRRQLAARDDAGPA